MRISSYDRDAPVPEVRSRWVWEAGRPGARQGVTVTDVMWNGEEWWVQSQGSSGRYWNDLGRFWEAVSPA